MREHVIVPTKQRVLSPFKLGDYIKLLWWVWIRPQKLKAYKSVLEDDERGLLERQGCWLVSTLSWMPLFAIALYSYFDAENKIALEVKIIAIVALLVAWFASSRWGLLEGKPALIAIIMAIIFAYCDSALISHNIFLSESPSLRSISVLQLLLSSLFAGFIMGSFVGLVGSVSAGTAALLLNDKRVLLLNAVSWFLVVGIASSYIMPYGGGAAVEAGIVSSITVAVAMFFFAESKKLMWITISASLTGIAVTSIVYLLTSELTGPRWGIGGIISGILSALTAWWGVYASIENRRNNYKNAQ